MKWREEREREKSGEERFREKFSYGEMYKGFFVWEEIRIYIYIFLLEIIRLLIVFRVFVGILGFLWVIEICNR